MRKRLFVYLPNWKHLPFNKDGVVLSGIAVSIWRDISQAVPVTILHNRLLQRGGSIGCR